MTDRDVLEDLCAKILSTNDAYWALRYTTEYINARKHLRDPRPAAPTPKGCEGCIVCDVWHRAGHPATNDEMECDPDRCLTCGGDGSVRE